MIAAGAGEFVIDFAHPEPSPVPVTTIAWRLAHMVVGVLGDAGGRATSAVPPSTTRSFDYAGTAARALHQLDDVYAAWRDGVIGLGEEDLARACGPAEGPFAAQPMAALVLHINREILHHGAEVALLRDLYANR